MLKKNIVYLGGIAIESHTFSQKNVPPPMKMTKLHQKVQNGPKWVILAILGVPKMALRVPESKF